MTKLLNPSTSQKINNFSNVFLALENLSNLTNLRLKLNFQKEPVTQEDLSLEFPMIYDDESPFATFIKKHQPNFEEYILLIMVLVPHVKIDFYDEIWEKHIPKTGNFPKIGGVRENNSRAFLPTVETALFILAGDNLEKRFEVQRLLSPEYWLLKQHILEIKTAKYGHPFSSGQLILNPEYVELFTVGEITKPALSLQFPAQQVTTELEWEDLVLPDKTLVQIEELKNWVEHHETLMETWGMGCTLKPGYRALFYGPPGTGKTLTASLLGKYTDKEVFRVDLSMIVSKFIGETEKNLSRLFDKARNKNWILFFDEADALFGKRTDVKDAHDRYANQEVSYLLQRVENYSGLVILSSNFKNNIDDAFVRRFNSIIPFPFPATAERLRLWEKAFPKQLELAPDINLKKIANRYKLSGANIMNIVQHVCLGVLAKKGIALSLTELVAGIRREFEKEGKVI